MSYGAVDLLYCTISTSADVVISPLCVFFQLRVMRVVLLLFEVKFVAVDCPARLPPSTHMCLRRGLLRGDQRTLVLFRPYPLILLTSNNQLFAYRGGL